MISSCNKKEDLRMKLFENCTLELQNDFVVTRIDSILSDNNSEQKVELSFLNSKKDSIYVYYDVIGFSGKCRNKDEIIFEFLEEDVYYELVNISNYEFFYRKRNDNKLYNGCIDNHPITIMLFPRGDIHKEINDFLKITE